MRPFWAVSAVAVLSDVSQLLNLGSHQHRCNSAVCEDPRRDFISSYSLKQLLRLTFGFSPSSEQISSRTAEWIPSLTSKFPSEGSYPNSAQIEGWILPLTDGLLSHISYQSPPGTVGLVPAPTVGFRRGGCCLLPPRISWVGPGVCW